MSETNRLGLIQLSLVALVILVVLIAAAWYGHVSSARIAEEVVAGAAEALLNVVIVGVVVLWFERRARLRDTADFLLREMRAIRDDVLEASFLMDAHRSAKTWTEQMRAVARLAPRVEELERSAQHNHFAASVAAIQQVGVYLRELKQEYRDEHDKIDPLSKQWDLILACAPRSQALLVDEAGSPLLTVLREAIDSLYERLR